MNTSINKIIILFLKSFDALGKQVAIPEIERMAVLVHRSMESPRRTFHTSQHVFDICHGMNALQTLAGIFHDIVYYQLDGGFSIYIREILADSVSQNDDGVRLNLGDSKLPHLQACATLFGFVDGQMLSIFGGLNEFCSAVVASQLLGPILSQEDLLAVVACIEATIPLRGSDNAENKIPERLFARLRQAFDQLSVACTDQSIEDIVKDAVTLANRDLKGFSDNDPEVFLFNTFLLILESNVTLLDGVYTIQEYRRALNRTYEFLSNLSTNNIFHQYKNTPDDLTYKKMIASARLNLEMTRRYLSVRLSTIAILEALALATGGDCPVSLLVGNIRYSKRNQRKVEDHLPTPQQHPESDHYLLQLLSSGTRSDFSWNLIKSPLAAYVYAHLGEEKVQQLFAHSKNFFANKMTHCEFLYQVEPELRSNLIAGCAEICLSRSDALKKILLIPNA